MNFKFLFNSNFTDSRLLQKMPNYEAEAQMFQEQLELERQKQLQQAQLLINQTSQQGMAARGISTTNLEEQVVTNPVNKVANNAVTNPFTFNGLAVDFTYNKDLSARLNRKLLKKKLKSIGGDKADATGIIYEYWAQNGGASGSDKKWLDARASQYGYTTDANGNRDYHRKPGNWGKALATIGGALLGGPLGAAGGYMLASLKSQIPGLKNGFFDPTSVKPAAQTQPVTEQPVVEQPVVEQPVTNPQPVTGFDPSKGVTFTGFSGDWGTRALLVYDANKDAAIWGTIAGDDNEITLDEFMAWLRANNVAGGADGKLGRNTLNALGLGNQQNKYSWMVKKANPIVPANPVVSAEPVSDAAYEMPENHLLSRNAGINNTSFEWLSPEFLELVSSDKVLEAKNKFGDGNSTFIKNSNGLYVAVEKPKQQKALNNAFTNAMLQTAYVENPAVMTALGWRRTNAGDYVQDLLHNPGVTKLRNNLAVIGATGLGAMSAGAASSFVAPTATQQALPWLSKPAGYLASPTGTILRDASGKVLMVYKQGGQLDDQDKMLLASTLGMIGYAASQGKLMLIEEAAALVASLAQSQPEALLELASNKELVNAGVQAVGQETVQQLSKPGVMKLLLTQVSKMPKAMNGTKLNYIKQLKGVCPEGYEMQYFAKGGHLCPVCKPKNIEEAKCGKKMKAKKHEGGGVSAAVNNVKEDMLKAKKDSTKTTFNDGRDKNLLKTSPKTYDKAKHLKLVNEFRKNGSSYKGWSKAKKDSLTRYNALLASDEDGDWSF